MPARSLAELAEPRVGERQSAENLRWFVEPHVSGAFFTLRRFPGCDTEEDPMRGRGPCPPEHLSEATKSWWRTVNQYTALEPEQLLLLRLSCEAWDSGQGMCESHANDAAEDELLRADQGEA